MKTTRVCLYTRIVRLVSWTIVRLISWTSECPLRARGPRPAPPRPAPPPTHTPPRTPNASSSLYLSDLFAPSDLRLPACRRAPATPTPTHVKRTERRAPAPPGSAPPPLIRAPTTLHGDPTLLLSAPSTLLHPTLLHPTHAGTHVRTHFPSFSASSNLVPASAPRRRRTGYAESAHLVFAPLVRRHWQRSAAIPPESARTRYDMDARRTRRDGSIDSLRTSTEGVFVVLSSIHVIA